MYKFYIKKKDVCKTISIVLIIYSKCLLNNNNLLSNICRICTIKKKKDESPGFYSYFITKL